MNRPRAVAKVPLDLAKHRRYREADEAGAAGGVEPVDRVQQADAGDLEHVLERFAGALVAAGDAAGQRQESLDQRVACRLVTGGAALQQLKLVDSARGSAVGHTSRIPSGD